MSVQRQRSTKTRRDRKRKRFVIKIKKTQNCLKCGKQTLPHRACPKCGYYRSREIVDVLKKNKKIKKK